MKAFVAAAAAVLAAAHPTFDSNEFKRVGRADPNAKLMFTAALPMRNIDVMDKKLAEISDPDSPKYGQWMTQAEVLTMMAPEQGIRKEVAEWVMSTGATCIDWPSSLRCSATVAQIESLLGTEMTTYEHVARYNRLVHRIAPGTSYSVPSTLAGKMLFMTNLVDFPTVRARNGRIATVNPSPTGPEVTDYTISVETLRIFYNMTWVTDSIANAQSTTSPAEFQDDQSYNEKDLENFTTQSGVVLWNVTNKVGPFAPKTPDAESTLDEQYMGSIGHGNQQWFWTEADWQYEFVQHLASLPDSSLPYVFSISWGWSEIDQCYVDPSGPCSGGNSQDYVTQTNAGFLAATSRGVSIMVSSGDSGAHGRTDPTCTSKKTRPDWPTSCPYITAVGATQIDISTGTPIKNPTSPFCKSPAGGLNQCAGGGTEIVCSTATGALIVSGGGFSEYATQPSWQSSAVAGYLASGALLPPTGDFNSTNRAYPDVAALGHNYMIWWSGSPTYVDGTSCSSPVFAGMVSYFNAYRLNNGKAVLGFLNPWLYKLGAQTGYFNDIVTGNNTCTENGCVAGCTGFGATKGWDATTGFGTPNFGNLYAAVSMLP